MLHIYPMLLQFTVSNFRAFREAQTLKLAASNYDKTLPGNCISREIPGIKGQRWLKGIALYGPNASGKSSVVHALQTLANLVTQSAATTDPKEPIRQIQSFALTPEHQAVPTAFGVVFVSDNVRYEYRVAATRKQVWHESLRAFPNAKEQLWFSRDWDAERNSYLWTPERPVGFRRDSKMAEFTLPNVLFLSKAISLGESQLEPVFRWFKEHLKFLDLSTRNPNLDFAFTAHQISTNTPIAPMILELLRHADLGVEDARVRHVELDGSTLALIDKFKELVPSEVQNSMEANLTRRIELLHHSDGSTPIALPWDAESAGTHRLFALAGPWLDILREGYTVFIDELETSMHPLMVIALLRLLFNDATNPKGAQVVFTTHNPLLLDATLIRRDQVWFTDKDDHGAAHLYPLTDYAPRKGESMVRGYMAGRYGAVPFIPEGLLSSFPTANQTTGGADGS